MAFVHDAHSTAEIASSVNFTLYLSLSFLIFRSLSFSVYRRWKTRLPSIADEMPQPFSVDREKNYRGVGALYFVSVYTQLRRLFYTQNQISFSHSVYALLCLIFNWFVLYIASSRCCFFCCRFCFFFVFSCSIWCYEAQISCVFLPKQLFYLINNMRMRNKYLSFWFWKLYLDEHTKYKMCIIC